MIRRTDGGFTWMIGGALFGLSLLWTLRRRREQKEQGEVANHDLDAMLEETFPASDAVAQY